MSVAVIIPTYNERDNIEPLTRDILALGRVDRVIIVDDNSPDGTGKLADGLSEAEQCISVVHRPGKEGLGRAYVAGFQQALALDSTVVMTMDADFSHDPQHIPAILDLLAEGYDIVIGSRYVPNGGTRNWGVERQLLSAGANNFARLMLGLQARDCTAGFRAYRRDVLQTIPMHEIRSNGYSFLVELLYRCQQAGFRVGEVPIVFEDRKRGQSKINQHEIIRAVGTVIRLALDRLQVQLRPPRGTSHGTHP